jgi:hypothetical protein
MTEVNRDSTYEGNMLVGEMDEYLAKFGFVGVEEHWPSPNWGWGDKCYIKIPEMNIEYGAINKLVISND